MHKHIKGIRGLVPSMVLAVAITVLPGCGKEQHKKAASQVVAIVNGDEISAHQINYVLSRTQGINTENADQAKQEILDKLIDQQLAIQQADAANLDRDPSVMQAIEAARRDILARAYLEKVAAAQARPTGDEVKKYFSDHPELFSHRRIYNLREIIVPVGNIADVQKLITQNKSMQEITDALKAGNVRFSTNAGIRTAEQLPLSAAARLHEAKDGQTVLLESPQGGMVVQIVTSQKQPVAENEALPKIEQFLTNQRAGDAIGVEMKSLRTKAKIELVGETSIAKTAPGNPAPTPTTGAIDANNVAKGLAGLK